MVTNQNQTVIVNAFSTSMLNHPQRLVVEFRRLSPENLQLQGEVVSYIRHPGTVQVLRQLLQREIPTSNGIYTYRSGDRIIMVVLVAPARGQEVVPQLSDLIFYEVVVREIE